MNIRMHGATMKLKKKLFYTKWFKYDRDWFVCKQAGYSAGHIWNNLYV